jgi:hypothetical protein
MITFKGDQSSDWRGLHFEENGKPVSLDRAMQEGFTIEPNDTPLVATLLKMRFAPRHNFNESDK